MLDKRFMQRVLLFVIISIFYSISSYALNANYWQTGNETFDSATNFTLTGGCTIASGVLSCTATQNGLWNVPIPNVSRNTVNITCAFDMAITDVNAGYSVRFVDAGNINNQVISIGGADVAHPKFISPYGTTDIIYYAHEDGTWNQYYFVIQPNGYSSLFINKTPEKKAYDYNKQMYLIGRTPTRMRFGDTSGGYIFKIDNLVCYNGTTYTPKSLPVDTTAPILNITKPSNNSFYVTEKVLFNISVSDNWAGNLSCYIRNQSNIFYQDNFTQTNPHLFNVTFPTGTENIFSLNVTCKDNASNSVMRRINITVDTIKPIITIYAPVNKTKYYRNFTNITLNVKCNDKYPYKLNVSMVYNNSIKYSWQNVSFTGTELSIKRTIDIVNYSNGLWNINITCSDGHTYLTSGITKTEKIGNTISYTTAQNRKLDISLKNSTSAICDFGSYSLKDREVFWYDFRCNKNATPPYVYHFTISKDYVYYPESPFKAHFIGLGQFITFGMDKQADYKIIENKVSYDVFITTKEKYLVFNHSVGAINTVKKFLQITITERHIRKTPFSDSLMIELIGILFAVMLLAIAPIFFRYLEMFLLSGIFTVALGLVCINVMPTPS